MALTPTPHNSAVKGDFAKTVLMPGDPLRAKFIAENFLTDAKLVTSVRNVYGYTGTYNGKPISVMASGMGCPSIGIYSWELFKFYDVDNIIRIGSAGSMVKDLHLYDVVMATAAYSQSTYAKVMSGYDKDETYPSEELNAKLRAASKKLGIPLHEGVVSSSDVFYVQTEDPRSVELNCVAAEMESFALFHNAKLAGKNAACLLTISDSLITGEVTTAEERQNSFTSMMKIALEAGIE